MTDAQINLAIAKICGWTYCDGWSHPDGRTELPEYCNDLNAMHEAEETLDFDQLCEMQDIIEYECGFAAFHATAFERAHAFLVTIGKWEEVQP